MLELVAEGTVEDTFDEGFPIGGASGNFWTRELGQGMEVAVAYCCLHRPHQPGQTSGNGDQSEEFHTDGFRLRVVKRHNQVVKQAQSSVKQAHSNCSHRRQSQAVNNAVLRETNNEKTTGRQAGRGFERPGRAVGGGVFKELLASVRHVSLACQLEAEAMLDLFVGK